MEIQPHVPHYYYLRFVTHEAQLIAPGGFMSPASNDGAPNQRLTFPPILWAGVSPFSFSLLYKASEGNYSLFFFRKSTQTSQSTPVLPSTKHSKLHSHSRGDFWRVLRMLERFRIFTPVSVHFPYSLTFSLCCLSRLPSLSKPLRIT